MSNVVSAAQESPKLIPVLPTNGINRAHYPPLHDRTFLVKKHLVDHIAAIADDCIGRVIDYGCGDMPYKPLFRRADTYTGADLGSSDPTVLALRDDFTVPLDSGSADVVTSFLVLEHVPDPSRYLRECGRLLRPGGKLILVTHGIWPYHPAPPVYEDYWRWTEAGLSRAVVEAGFDVSGVKHVCGGWLSLLQQFVALSDPWVEPEHFLKRRLRQAGNLLVNGAALLGEKTFGVRPPRRGDIIPICYLVMARRNDDSLHGI